MLVQQNTSNIMSYLDSLGFKYDSKEENGKTKLLEGKITNADGEVVGYVSKNSNGKLSCFFYVDVAKSLNKTIPDGFEADRTNGEIKNNQGEKLKQMPVDEIPADVKAIADSMDGKHGTTSSPIISDNKTWYVVIANDGDQYFYTIDNDE